MVIYYNSTKIYVQSVHFLKLLHSETFYLPAASGSHLVLENPAAAIIRRFPGTRVPKYTRPSRGDSVTTVVTPLFFVFVLQSQRLAAVQPGAGEDLPADGRNLQVWPGVPAHPPQGNSRSLRSLRSLRPCLTASARVLSPPRLRRVTLRRRPRAITLLEADYVPSELMSSLLCSIIYVFIKKLNPSRPLPHITHSLKMSFSGQKINF